MIDYYEWNKELNCTKKNKVRKLTAYRTRVMYTFLIKDFLWVYYNYIKFLFPSSSKGGNVIWNQQRLKFIRSNFAKFWKLIVLQFLALKARIPRKLFYCIRWLKSMRTQFMIFLVIDLIRNEMEWYRKKSNFNFKKYV